MKDRGKIIYHWVVPDDYPDFTGYDDIADQYRIIEDDRSSSGIIIQAKYNGEWRTNPWNTRVLVRHLLDVIQIFNDKRKFDCLNGRMWDATEHLKAEKKIEKIIREFIERKI